MQINGQNFKVENLFDHIVTVPDCIVLGDNKLGGGHGESKLYFGTKEEMRSFFGKAGFVAPCFVLKKDLITYLETLKEEYMHPSQPYRGAKEFPTLWAERMKKVQTLPEVIPFNVTDQTQIQGPRGYINSSDFGYQLIRELSLPLVSYISAMEIKDSSGHSLFYWKLFVDFDAIAEKKNGPLVFIYGKGVANKGQENEQEESPKNQEIRKARIGQGKYRELLLEECPFCPITMISDDRLLIASHIKPWAVSTDKEKIDPQNGFMLSPLYDKLFDRGFITFTDDKHVQLSNWISAQNWKRIGIHDNDFFQALPITEARKVYLEFHRKSVFKG
ncbi:HNH endonuclease [Candidatus Avelusimicrobium luingense]|uniref:HNH endonuclease n=1 Tax=Candidatus Avelusimicrobium luingense TaxID=3416211 RepID=UPI003D10733F